AVILEDITVIHAITDVDIMVQDIVTMAITIPTIIIMADLEESTSTGGANSLIVPIER
ncbi:MAG: hypothetical protein K940chlam7_01483, partial [Chlamydiae bacterium]|nr:hypothetical protein [Chlamydiota bacterium]